MRGMEEDRIVKENNVNVQAEEEKDEVKKDGKLEERNLEEVEERIGYKFNNKSLLSQALTGKSYNNDCSTGGDGLNYERLEYYGDAVLNMLITKRLYNLYPHMSSGEMTLLRAANVDTEKLARAALKLHLHKYLHHDKPLLDQRIEEFRKGIDLHPIHSYGLIDPPKVLADIVESTIGAVFIDTDHSLDLTWKVVQDMLQPMITPETCQKNPVTRLMEICQKIGSIAQPQSNMWEKTGEVVYIIDNEFAGKGTYKLKKLIAINRAANEAYKNFVIRKQLQDKCNLIED